MRKIRIKIVKIAGYILFLLVVIILLLEVLVRLFDPFDFRQRGDKVVLPVNKKMIFRNDRIPGLDSQIIHTKNSLGFRGPEPPPNFHELTTIIAIGGSTTECFYISDSLCWTNLLHFEPGRKVWVNNAGFQGHSTYGNFILVNEYVKQIQPDYVLLMEGINEINRTDIRKDESVSAISTKLSFLEWFKRNSRVLDAIINIRRNLMAGRLGVTDNYFDPAAMQQLELSTSFMDSVISAQTPLSNAYANRLNEIVDTCLANEIIPVLITQPILYGDTTDCETPTDLGSVKITDGYNGLLMWKLIELYNEETRRIAGEHNFLLIDLAAELPKCSRYFYDICHFTNEGSVKVAEIINKRLSGYIR